MSELRRTIRNHMIERMTNNGATVILAAHVADDALAEMTDADLDQFARQAAIEAPNDQLRTAIQNP